VLVSRPGRRARNLTVAIAASVAFSLVSVPLSVHAAPPPNPSDQAITAAQAAKDALGSQVGTLSAQVTALQAQLNHLRANAQLAEQKVALALEQLQTAKDAEVATKQQVSDADAAIVSAQQNFTDFIRSSYMLGPASGTIGGLITATDPQSMLQHADYIHYTATHQLDAIGAMNRAKISKSNADAAARGAVQQEASAEAAAEQAKTNADAAASAAAQQTAQVSAALAGSQAQLESAQSNLATLNGQRAAYDAYQAQQAALLAAQQAAARAAAEAASRAGAGTGNGGGVAIAPNPTGSWTPAIGQTAVNRAMAFMNWPYSFAAGNANGPTYGVAVDYDSRNDAHVRGFDCSGLTLYAYAPYIRLDHYAATQYTQAGHLHPNTASLMPGDLVFWSDDGTISGIGHVAIYIGGGNVIQAPYSGAFITITPLGRVESGYFGATRPLT
jgi:cell wall-associated NlpC family hydrolase